MAVAMLSILILYQAALTEQRGQLTHLAQSQARHMESMAVHFSSMGMAEEKVLAASIKQITRTREDMVGFGETGEFLLARRGGGMIVFLLGGGISPDRGKADPVAFESSHAAPMRRALLGQSGTMIGTDYGGIEVLAAYLPVKNMNLGIVAKVDTAEVRAPFIRAGVISGFGAVVIILLGTILFNRISTPLVENLEKAVARLTEAQHVARMGNWERITETGEGWWSDETYRIFGLEPRAVSPTLKGFLDRVHPEDRAMVKQAVEKCMQGKEPYSIEYRIVRPDGSTLFIYGRGTWSPGTQGRPARIAGTIQDVTDRKRTESNIRRLAAAIEGLSENFALYGPDDRLVICNKGYRDLNEAIAETTEPGIPFEQHARALVAKGLVMEAVGREEEWVRERMKEHRNPGGPFEVTRQDGQCFLVHEQRMADDSTAIIATDITERKRTEEALRESEQRFKDYAEVASDWFWEMDSDLRFIYFSDRFSEISGVAQEDLIGKTRQESGLDMEDERVRRNIEDLEARRPFTNYEHSRVRPDGSVVHMSTSGTPIFDEDGAFQGYRGTGTDVTERKRTEEDLRRALVRAEEASQAKSSFLATMSHELRTPLNSIIGFSETLKTQMFGPLGNQRYQEYAEDINFSGLHLLDVITDILDISKIEAGEVIVAEEEVDLLFLVEASIKMLREQAEEQGITLSRLFPHDCPKLHADPRHIKQIILNLVSNAVKFTPPKGKISLEVAVDDEQAVLLVIKDNGIGIDEKNIAKVLEPFGQVGDVYSRAHEGTGLGLPLAKSLVEIHGGSLVLASKLGEGTTVTVRFPPERTIPAESPLATVES